MKMNRFSRWFLMLSIMIFTQSVVAADLIMTAPPREKPEAGKKIYGPVADHLSKLLGKKVVYEHPKNWLNYQRDMRNDKYDVVFDGPHFISWRMAHLGHTVIAKLPGTLVFHLTTSKQENETTTVNSLVAKKICGISPPNLSTLSILAAYPNPVRQPVIVGIKGGMGAVHKSYQAGKCRAAIFRRAFFKKKLPEAARNNYKIIYSSKAVPNQGFSLSKRLTAREINLVTQSLTLGDGVKATAGILRRFGGKAKSFQKANTAEFIGHNLLLEGVIFGW